MARIRIGNDYTGCGAFKVMKNNADDPYSTPDSERWKFLYNSKFGIQASLCDIWVVNTFQAGSGVTYYPPGSNSATFTYMSVTVAQGTLWGFRNIAFPTLRYNVPLFDVKAKKGGGSNVYNQQMVAWTDSSEYYHGQGGYYAVGNFAQLDGRKTWFSTIIWGTTPTGPRSSSRRTTPLTRSINSDHATSG
ncbi:hypothetical protein [Ensifer sp. 4252]|uniref:hypothetical protein n=1 Tax=Ensifer sp. 4252 TaxID=3373915 RepID=UPI003D1B9A96